MKKTVIVSVAWSVLLGMSACSSADEVLTSNLENPVDDQTLTADFEGFTADTRISLGSDKSVQWEATDAFRLFYSIGTTTKSTKFSTATAGASVSFTGSLDDGEKAYTYAAFPYVDGQTLNGNVLSTTLPTSFDCNATCHTPMYATVSSLGSNISFKQLGGLLKATISSGVDETTKMLVITASSPIAGAATVDFSADTPVLVVKPKDEGGSNTLTININVSETTSTTFYIPLPVGTYTKIEAELRDAQGSKVYTEKIWENVIVKRAALLTSSFHYTTIQAGFAPDGADGGSSGRGNN